METKKTPIQILTATLAEMTERAITAEAERDSAEQNVRYWVAAYNEKVEDLKKTNKEWNAMRDKLEKLQKKYEGEKTDD